MSAFLQERQPSPDLGKQLYKNFSQTCTIVSMIRNETAYLYPWIHCAVCLWSVLGARVCRSSTAPAPSGAPWGPPAAHDGPSSPSLAPTPAKDIKYIIHNKYCDIIFIHWSFNFVFFVGNQQTSTLDFKSKMLKNKLTMTYLFICKNTLSFYFQARCLTILKHFWEF